MSHVPSRAAFVVAFAAIYLIWGSTYLGIRIAVESAPPFLMAGTRFLVAGLIMAALVAFFRGFRPTAAQWRDNTIVGGFLLLGGNGLVSWAEQKVPSGIATLIISCGPVFVVLMDWAIYARSKNGTSGNKPGLMTFAGLALGIAGLVVLVGPDVLKQGVGALDPLSVTALVAATFLWSIGMMIMRYLKNPAEPFTASAMQMICGSGWLLLTSGLAGEFAHFSTDAVTLRSFVAWVGLVLIGSLGGFSTFTWLMKHSTPAKVSTYAYVNPVVAVFLGWLVLDEPLSPRLFSAAVFIIAGVALITIARNRKPTAATSAPIPTATPELKPQETR